MFGHVSCVRVFGHVIVSRSVSMSGHEIVSEIDRKVLVFEIRAF